MRPAEVLARIEESGLVMVVRSRTADDALAAIGAARVAGIGTVQVTFTTPDAADVIERVRAEYDDLIVGAGTVLSGEQAEHAAGAGAEFIVSPGLDRDLLDWGGSRDVLTIPGVLSPSEVIAAVRAGVCAVKLFPAQTVGPAHLGALLAPFPDLRILPTGGVTATNTPDWLGAGAVAVGIGGALSPSVPVTPAVAGAITSAAKQSIASVRTFRNRANQENT